jgi:uncharacterized protein YdiU (UPF0061 family)
MKKKQLRLQLKIIDNFQNIYEEKWLNMMRDKLGLFGEDKNDKKLIDDLLRLDGKTIRLIIQILFAI